MNNILKIIIADDHPHEIIGIKELLALVDWIKVIDTDTTAQGAVLKTIQNKPDVVLLDINYQGNSDEGLHAIRQIREGSPETRIAVMTNYDSLLEAARAAGADRAIHKNYLATKEAYAEHILAAYNARLLPTIEGDESIIEKLSRREKQVLELMCEGLSDKEIANRLSIALGTEKKYVSGIYDRLDVKGRAEAVSKAVQRGLLSRKKERED